MFHYTPHNEKELPITQVSVHKTSYCIVYYRANNKPLGSICCWNSKKCHTSKLVKLCKHTDLLKSMAAISQLFFNNHHFSRSKKDVLFLWYDFITIEI